MKKVIIISAIVLGSSVLCYALVQSIRRIGIKKRLDESFAHPDSQEASGGMNKLLQSGAFNPNTYKQTGKATITLLEAREHAKRIWDAYSYYFSSDQSTIVNAFNGLGHQSDVSKIAHEFKGQYDEDLIEVLKSALTDKAKLNMLIAKIGKLPKD